MDFLQGPGRPKYDETKESHKSKHYEKEKRNTTKAQNEISTYFESHRAPTGLAKHNTQHPPSETSEDDVNNQSMPKAKIPRHPINPSLTDIAGISYSKSKKHAKSTSGMPGQPGNSSMSYDLPPPVPHSSSKNSSLANNYISWSETQLSRSARKSPKRTDPQHSTRRALSPTPISIQKSIEETGVFQGTGIDLARRFKDIETNDRLFEATSSDEQVRQGDCEVFDSTICLDRHAGGTGHQITADQDLLEQQRSPNEAGNCEPHPSTHSRASDRPSTLRRVDTHIADAKTAHTESNTTYLDSGGDSRRLEDLSVTTPHKPENVARPSRQDIAKSLRIRRPSTAIPISTNAEVVLGSEVLAAPVSGDQRSHSVGPRQSVHMTSTNETKKAECTRNGNQSISEEASSQYPAVIQKSNTLIGRSNTSQGNQTNEEQPKEESGFSNAGNSLLPNARDGQSAPTLMPLPVRGSWVDRNSLIASHAMRLSPMIEEPPLFMRQIHVPSSYTYTHPHIWKEQPEYQSLTHIGSEGNFEMQYGPSEEDLTYNDFPDENLELTENFHEHAREDPQGFDCYQMSTSQSAMVHTRSLGYSPENVRYNSVDDHFYQEEMFHSQAANPNLDELSHGYELYEEDQDMDVIPGFWHPYPQY